MEFELTIKFRNSSSSSFDGVIKKAKSFNNFEPSSDKKGMNSLKIKIEEFVKKYSLYDSIMMNVRSWKGTELLFNDIPLERNSQFELEKFIRCYSEYNNAVIQESHCKINDHKEGWGCKLLESIDRYNDNGYFYNKNQHWYEFGQFKEVNIWEINKEEIKRLLRREADLKYLIHCPKFDVNKIEDTIDKLPDSINIDESDYWETKYDMNIDGVELEKKPVGIIPKSSNKRSNGFRTRISFGLGESDEEEEENNQKNYRYIPDITYKDIGGVDDILQKIREVIEIPIKRPDIFSILGITPHKGILLYGPPGCGKTLIAKAIANQVQGHFISIKGPELISKWHGQSEENLRTIFEDARRLQPSIIFFDEIDSIAQRRSSEETLRLDSRFVNQLLTLMDGMEEYSNVKIIATTNRVELIDEALLRPGRFDYHIEINKPKIEGCIKIFKINTEKMPIENGFDKEYFASKLFGLTGADISFICREGAYNCLRRNIKGDFENMEFDFKDIDHTKFIIKEEDFTKALNLIKK